MAVGTLARTRGRGNQDAPVATTDSDVLATTAATAGGPVQDIPLAKTPETSVAEAAPTPTPDQQALIDAYGDAQRGVLDTLNSWKWYDSSRLRVRFSGNAFLVEGGTWHTFAVSSVEVGPSQQMVESPGAPPYTVQDTNVTFLDEEGKTWLATVETTTDGNGTSVFVSDSPFAVGGQLMSFASSKPLSFQMPPELAQTTGLDDARLSAALGPWAKENVPSADSATWDGKVTSNEAAKTRSFTLALNDYESTKVTITYHTDTGKIDLEAVGD